MAGLALAIAASCLLTPAVARADLGTSLELYSTMDNVSSYVPPIYWEDVSGNAYHAVTNPGAYDGSGDPGGTYRTAAIDFTGGDLRMKVADGLNADFDPGVGDYSVSLWYNEATTNSFSYLLAKGNTVSSSSSGFCLGTTNGNPIIRMNDVGQSDTTKVTVDSGMGDISATGWHHLVAVFDRSGTYSAQNTVSLYVDNVLRSSAVLDPVFPSQYDVSNASKEFVLGGQEASTSYDFDGYLDDVAVYRGVLSTSQVNTLYSAPILDAGTISGGGVNPVAIHNFATNRNQNESFATLADDYDGHSGLLQGTAVQVADPTRGNVLEIVGDPGSSNANYVSYGDVLDPGSASYTTSFWFKINDGDYSRNLVSKGMSYSSGDGGWSTGFSATDDAIYFRANYGDDDHRLNIKKDIAPEDMDDFLNSWHHMVAIINQEGGYIEAYLDGEGSGATGTDNGWQITTSSYYATFTPGESFETDTTRAAPINELTLGGGKSGRDPLNGMVDDLAIWSRALTEAEILGIYDGTLTIPTAPGIPGDATGDNVVDAADAQRMADNWGATTLNPSYTTWWEMGDFNGDEVVDMKDASILAANWGYGGSEAAAVPEPSSLLLMVLAAVASIARRKRGRPAHGPI